jgi:folate-binding protein YgfZ
MTNPADTTPAPTRPARPVVLVDAEHAAYDALRTGATVFDLAPRHVSQFTGAAAGGALNGLVTNDVLPLAVGRGLFAAALTPKGKMLADMAILRTEPETFLVETSAEAGAEWMAMVRKYVNPRLAKYVDLSSALSPIGVYGPRAAELMARLGGATGGGAMLSDALSEALEGWPEWGNASWNVPGNASRLVRAPYLGDVAGFMLLATVEDASALRARLVQMGAVAGTPSVWALAALEAGRPAFGLDADAGTIPQEANLDSWRAVSFEKGCYTGQETVARVHFRGHVNRHLRGLRSATPLEVGQPAYDAGGKLVGEVRRSGVSPRFGPIAVAMLRREIAPGDTVRIGADAVPVLVTVLPFAPVEGA